MASLVYFLMNKDKQRVPILCDTTFSKMEERRVMVRHCTSSDMDIELCYQTFGAPKDPAVILVGGLNMQSYAWDEGFCEALVLRGFYVIRFDNRDIGHSTKIEFPTSSTAGGPLHSNATSSGPSESQLSSSVQPAPSPAPFSHLDVNTTTSSHHHHTSVSIGSSSVLQRSTTPGDSESSSSSSCVARINGGGHNGSGAARPQRPSIGTSSIFSSLDGRGGGGPSDTTHLFSPTKRSPSSRGSKLRRLFWWCSRDCGVECLVDSAHFVKDTATTAVRRALCMTGLVDSTSPTFYPPAATRRPPKIVPWKLMLPQALSCGEVLPYTLEDMALDALALLDVLGVRRAHVFGISMGGMISQHMALLAPERVLTLTCIMSSTNAQDLPHPAWWVKLWMLRKPASNVNREQLVEFRMKALQGLLYGCVPVDEDYLKKRIAMSLNRSSYADGLLRQAAAIMRAPSRDAELTRVIRCPCLVIHGQNDVLCRVEHGYRLAKVLTNSKFVVFKNMGHYLNPAYFDAIVSEFLALAERGRIYEAAEQERASRHMRNCNRVSARYEDVV